MRSTALLVSLRPSLSARLKFATPAPREISHFSRAPVSALTSAVAGHVRLETDRAEDLQRARRLRALDRDVPIDLQVELVASVPIAAVVRLVTGGL